MTAISEEVSRGLQELAAAFPDHPLEHRPDGGGGTWVMMQAFALGPAFTPHVSWIAFPLSGMYPRAHVYPHYVDPALARVDGRPLEVPLHAGQQVPVFGFPAVMVSRSSPGWDPSRDTAVSKLERLLLWFGRQGVGEAVAA